MATKFIFITGGVVSSLGKGVTAASIGTLMESCGLNIQLQKCDPYLNRQLDKISPEEHGEIFYLKDGTPTDLDFGYYHRFTNSILDSNCSITTGKIYHTILTKEENSLFSGQTIQVIPHVTDEIKYCIEYNHIRYDDYGYKNDIVITEIGGTVGDIEGLPYLEAVRQFIFEHPKEDCLLVHLSLLPRVTACGEIKTKPTQHSVERLRQLGLQPDILICRTDCIGDLDIDSKNKISRFCNIDETCIFEESNIKKGTSLYSIPCDLQHQGLDQAICSILGIYKVDIKKQQKFFSAWRNKTNRNHSNDLHIGIVGKYKNADAYKTVIEALHDAGAANGATITPIIIPFENSSIRYDLISDTNLCEMEGIVICDKECGRVPRDIAEKYKDNEIYIDNVPPGSMQWHLNLYEDDQYKKICRTKPGDSVEFVSDFLAACLSHD